MVTGAVIMLIGVLVGWVLSQVSSQVSHEDDTRTP